MSEILDREQRLRSTTLLREALTEFTVSVAPSNGLGATIVSARSDDGLAVSEMHQIDYRISGIESDTDRSQFKRGNS
jgi:hypothetical protein